MLTHDVEGPGGVAHCRELMKLEMKLGFRSSFNFIPEGTYSVPKELREELGANGFEVGVHDLRHDGKLYRSRAAFVENAQRINHYLQEWGAVGFRAGFMLRNLEWLHDLNVEYDASTFDTDPFEPQPDGANTIFPFWVPRKRSQTVDSNSAVGSDAREGYVELPYSLPQDSTLHLVLRDAAGIWQKKLDWVVENGGMALVNVHPDYLRFPGEPPSARTFPAERYAELLQYVRTRYSQSFWHALPKEVASFAAPLRLSVRPKRKRVCMMAYSCSWADTRVARYADALAERGDEVDILELKGASELPDQERIRGVNIVRIQPRIGKKESSRVSFLLPLLRFLIVSSVWIGRRHLHKRYDLLHIHNVPDFLVFAGYLPKLTGAKVILDIHDILPEFYATKFSAKLEARSIVLLKWIERVSARLADRVILGNDLWLDKYEARTGAKGKCSAYINNVDTEIFRPRRRTRNDGKIIMLFPGGLQWHQGVDIAIRAFHKASGELPNAEFHIYGDGNMKPSLVALTKELDLDGKVRFFDTTSIREIAEIMANADLGVVPKRADGFGNEAYSTKIMEFMSLRVPVVVSNTKIDRTYFDLQSSAFLSLETQTLWLRPWSKQSATRIGVSAWWKTPLPMLFGTTGKLASRNISRWSMSFRLLAPQRTVFIRVTIQQFIRGRPQ